MSDESTTRGLCETRDPAPWDVDASREEHIKAARTCMRCPRMDACLRDVKNRFTQVRITGVYAGLMWDRDGGHPVREWHQTHNHHGTRDRGGEEPPPPWSEERQCVALGCRKTFTVTPKNKTKRVCGDVCSGIRRRTKDAIAS